MVSCKDTHQLARAYKTEVQGKVLDAPTVKAVVAEWLQLILNFDHFILSYLIIGMTVKFQFYLY